MKRYKLDSNEKVAKEKMSDLCDLNDKYLQKLAASGVNQNVFDEVHKSLLKTEAYAGNEISWALYRNFDYNNHDEVKEAQASAKDAEPTND